MGGAVRGMAAIGGIQGSFRQFIIQRQLETVIDRIHQQLADLQIFRAEGVRQVITQRGGCPCRQVDLQLGAAVKLIHKLAAVATG
ncbi:hypothetical protein D3C75_806480 [compost metagenome]